VLYIPVANMGGQYNHLIVRMLLELGVRSELIPFTTPLEELERKGVDGYVLGGGPWRIHEALDKLAPLTDVIRRASFPILGICLTHQLLACAYGGSAGPAGRPEYGPVIVYVDEEDDILRSMPKRFRAWGSHNDEVKSLPSGFRAIAHSKYCRVEAMANTSLQRYGVQFHPEVIQTVGGRWIFRNFIEVCCS